MSNCCIEYQLNFKDYQQVAGLFLSHFQRKILIKYLQQTIKPGCRRRIEIILLADIGKSQAEICEIVGCSRRITRYWMNIIEQGVAHRWDKLPITRATAFSS